MSELTDAFDAETQVGYETLNSDYEVIGTIPNMEALLSSPLIEGKHHELRVLLDEAQQPERFEFTSPGGELGETQQAELLELLLPTVRLIDTSRRKVHGRDRTALGMSIADQQVSPREGMPIENSNRVPHTDDYGVGFLGVIGPQTMYWPGEFKVPTRASRADKIQAFMDQIKQNHMEPSRPNDGEVVRIGPETVHQSPADDPAITGERRLFLQAQPFKSENF